MNTVILKGSAVGSKKMPTSYKVNSPKVSSENIDGEVIIVNLETGTYYSTVDSGAYVWGRITAGDSAQAISDKMLAAFGAERTVIETAVTNFIGRLEAEQLVVKCNGAGSVPTTNVVEAGLPRLFSEPVLNCYSDMQDMLLLDPVHDVADVGWPSAKSE